MGQASGRTLQTAPPCISPVIASAASADATQSGHPFAARHDCELERARLRAILLQCVAWVFGIDERAMRTPSRGKAPIALARQAAMYIAHTGCSMNLTEVGALFGRDRTTVRHACSAIEDLRDDPVFDRRLDLIDQSVRQLAIVTASPSVEPAP